MAQDQEAVAYIELPPGKYRVELRHPKTKVLYTVWADSRYQAEVKARELADSLGIAAWRFEHRKWSSSEKGMPVKSDAV